MKKFTATGFMLSVVSAVLAAMVLLGATTAAGFDPYESSTSYCGPKMEAYNRTLPQPYTEPADTRCQF